MTREDVGRLFELLAIYRPGDRHLQDSTLRSAWALVLAPYSPESVREAVGAYFRESKFWPDVTDLAQRCPAIQRPLEDRGHSKGLERDQGGLGELAALGDWMEKDYPRWGVPHPNVARGEGWSPQEWVAACRRAQETEAQEIQAQKIEAQEGEGHE